MLLTNATPINLILIFFKLTIPACLPGDSDINRNVKILDKVREVQVSIISMKHHKLGINKNFMKVEHEELQRLS